MIEFSAFTYTLLASFILAFILAGLGTVFRVPLELSLIIFVLMPVSVNAGARVSSSLLTALHCVAGASVGALFALALRSTGRWPQADILWHSISFVITALIWSALFIIAPIHEAAVGWRASANVGIDALRPVIRSVDRAAPWLAVGYLLPFLIIAAVFLGYTLML